MSNKFWNTFNRHDLNVLFLFMKVEYMMKELLSVFLFLLWYTNVVVKSMQLHTTQQMLSLSSLRGFTPTQNFLKDNNNMHGEYYSTEIQAALIRLFGRRVPKSFSNNILGRQQFSLFTRIIRKSYAKKKHTEKVSSLLLFSQIMLRVYWIVNRSSQLNRLSKILFPIL